MANALFSRTQQRVLALLFVDPERSYFANELVRLSDSGVGAVHRELATLEAAGLVTARRAGNRRHYQANRTAPVFDELHGLAKKIFGAPASAERPAGAAAAPALHETRARYDALPAGLRVPAKKLKSLCRKYRIRKLSAFGSAARGDARADSDVDLMVEFDPENAPSLWEFPGMQSEFSRLFGRKVDLVPPQVLDNAHRRRAILPELRVLYAA